MTNRQGPWHLVEAGPSILRVHFSLADGQESGVALSIGSTALQFRASRQGSHRGETMVYRPFSESDRANGRLIAAAPELLAALKDILAISEIPACATREKAVAAIAKAEGRG